MSYVVIGNFNPDSAVGRAVFGEIAEGRVENAHYLTPREYRPKGKIGALLLRTIKYCKWHSILPGIFGRYGSVGIGRIRPLLDGREDTLIFCPSTHPFTHIPEGYIEGLRRRLPGCRFVYSFVDGVERTAMINRVPVSKITDFVRRFDCVTTYDREDAQKFGYTYVDLPVWHDRGEAPETDADIYFCGRDKQRADLLWQVYDRLEREGVRCRYRVAGSADSDYSRKDITFSDWTPYANTVRELRGSNCVLEIIASQNRGATLRYKEAVIYNKKLLTTNPELASLPYYDPRFMRTFARAEDIDIDWLRSPCRVDYGYRGDFTAECFLRSVHEACGRK